MQATVRKVGETFVLEMPPDAASLLRLVEGAVVNLDRLNGRLLVAPVGRPGLPNMAALAEQITPENRHPEIEWGPPVGKEVG